MRIVSAASYSQGSNVPIRGRALAIAGHHEVEVARSAALAC
jgi:hypothetical protein